MLAVSNTSPISNLAHIERLDLLRPQFPLLLIPGAVSVELSAHPDPAASAAIHGAVQDGWIRVAPVVDSPMLRMLRAQVHRGEAEAIALAAELQASMVIIDELEGRGLAVNAGLSVTGTLGVLLKAKRAGLIDVVKPEIVKLRDIARFFIAPALEAKVLAASGE